MLLTAWATLVQQGEEPTVQAAALLSLKQARSNDLVALVVVTS
jgi:hypothetical protein